MAETNVEKRFADLERRLDESEAANDVLKNKNSELAQLVTQLRPSMPKEQELYRTVEGQGSVPLDRVGNRIVAQADPNSTTVGAGSSFGKTYDVGPDGRRVLVADGLRRDPSTGEVITSISHSAPIPMGPQRSHSHQQSIDMLDRMFPIHKPSQDPED